MSRFYSIFKFIQHRLHSRRWDSFHSPYLFNLFTYCCDHKIVFPEIEGIESHRNKLIHSKETINRTDFGAGMTISDNQHEKRISSIARQSLSLPFQCRFLYKLMQLTKPEICIEFGTCLGITSLYLSYGADAGKIISIEGDPAIASMAKHIFEEMQIKNITSINSTFEDFINQDLKELETIDFIFIDGNHRSGPLLSYYHALKPHLRSNTIIMVDDIYWSSDMNSGWTSLTEMPEVTQSVDCFQFGLLFFSSDFISNQNHIIRLPLKSII
ncbi:MAG: class I SAM-dependent methyltransferase [Saprospiraceae bacterium]|uniref:Class I SAM-dependent methyltransferase n=1 Tax=Candidatus Opimibacter skivensis TaxID=2982028 RepID=A0A9D7STI0_9BACT|nr:class I SAM-dependent methyltransferase [Candidatus Opimibacter skivensis]